MIKLIIGDSTRGYDSAELVKKPSGKFTLITGSIRGRATWIKKALANVNRGNCEYVTSAGDVLPVVVRDCR